MTKRPSVEERVEADRLFRKTEEGKGKRRYRSDVETPAVATRVSRQEYEELKAIAEEAEIPLAHVLQAVILDFLERYRKGEAKLQKADVNHTREFRRLVTRVVTTRNELVTSS
jgi:hypothetical protein